MDPENLLDLEQMMYYTTNKINHSTVNISTQDRIEQCTDGCMFMVVRIDAGWCNSMKICHSLSEYQLQENYKLGVNYVGPTADKPSG